MPTLARALLERLRAAPPAPAVVPRHAGGPEPLCARYHRALGPLVAAALSSGTRALHVFLDGLDGGGGVAWIDEPELRRLDPELRSFANLNTRADLHRA
jgi:molybdopterin-guanine dinucleotide biosynthesis protein A